MKKKIGILCLVIGIIAAAAIVVLVGIRKFDWFNKVTDYDKEVANKLEGYNADIIVYGNLATSKKSVIKYRTIEKLSDDNLDQTESDYHLIVLADMDGTLDLDSEDINLLYRYAFDEHYDVVYFGTAHMQALMDGLLCKADMSSEHSFWFNGYAYRSSFPYEYVNGEWRQTNTEGEVYVAHPCILQLDYSEEDNEKALEETSEVWQWVGWCALYSLENE